VSNGISAKLIWSQERESTQQLMFMATFVVIKLRGVMQLTQQQIAESNGATITLHTCIWGMRVSNNHRHITASRFLVPSKKILRK